MKYLFFLLGLFYSLVLPAQSWVDTLYTISTEFDHVYGVANTFAGAEDTLLLDVSFPQNDMPPECGRPLMVIIHGGAWIAGDKSEGYANQMRKDFAKRGYVTASVNYRLGLFHTNQFVNCNVPDWNCYNMTDSSEWYRANYRGIQDVHGAIRYLINQAETYQIDPSQVFVVGESAGAFIALGVGFLDDDSEVISSYTAAYPDAPAPNTLYENACILNYGLADGIASMDLSRPDLGSYLGELNWPLEVDYQIRGVGNFFGATFNDIFKDYQGNSPDLYQFHQPCDLIVPFNYNRLLAGLNGCLSGFPTNCGSIINRPHVYGSKGIESQIDAWSSAGEPTCEYLFENSGNNFDCLQQALDPSLACHALDNYWLRTTNMATFFADRIDSCVVSVNQERVEEGKVGIRLSPNPVSDRLYLAFDQLVDAGQIQVYNVLGELVTVLQISQKTAVEIETSSWKPGHYYIYCQFDNTITVLTSVKE